MTTPPGQQRDNTGRVIDVWKSAALVLAALLVGLVGVFYTITSNLASKDDVSALQAQYALLYDRLGALEVTTARLDERVQRLGNAQLPAAVAPGQDPETPPTTIAFADDVGSPAAGGEVGHEPPVASSGGEAPAPAEPSPEAPVEEGPPAPAPSPVPVPAPPEPTNPSAPPSEPPPSHRPPASPPAEPPHAEPVPPAPEQPPAGPVTEIVAPVTEIVDTVVDALPPLLP